MARFALLIVVLAVIATLVLFWAFGLLLRRLRRNELARRRSRR